MPNRSNDSNMTIEQSIAPDLYQTNNTTVAGSAVDTRGYDAVTCFVSVNDWGDTGTGGWEFSIQESDDTVAGNFTDVADADLTYTVTGDSTVTGAADSGVYAVVDAADEDDQVYTTGYIGNKRYIRQYATATGNQSTGTDLEAGFILELPDAAPTGDNRSS